MSNFKGIFIPSTLLKNKNLTPTDKFLLAYIINFKDGCFASDKYIAETLGVEAKTVRNSLTKLRSLGLIKSSKNHGSRLLCPEIGTNMSLNKDIDVPKSGQVCPEIGNCQQGSDLCSNNNSNNNYTKNCSSNAGSASIFTTTEGEIERFSSGEKNCEALGRAEAAILEFQKQHGLSTHSGTIAEIKRQLLTRGYAEEEIAEDVDSLIQAKEQGSLWATIEVDEAINTTRHADFALVSLMAG